MTRKKINKYKILENDVVEIELTQGKLGYCDLKNWIKFKLYTYVWYAFRGRNRVWYIRTNLYFDNGDKKLGRTGMNLHQMIFPSLEHGQVINHKDFNGLNCLENNMEICTKQQNNSYQRTRLDNRSGYKGVGWDEKANKWRARIQINKKREILGWFENPIEAAKVYNTAAMKYFGHFAFLNEIPENSVDK